MSGSGRASRSGEVDLCAIAEAVLDAMVILDASPDARRRKRHRLVGGVELMQALEVLAADPVAAPPPLDVLEAGLREIEQSILRQERQLRRSPLARLLPGRMFRLAHGSRRSTATTTARMKVSQQLLHDVRLWQRALRRYDIQQRPPADQPELVGVRSARMVSEAPASPAVQGVAKPARQGKPVAAKVRQRLGLHVGKG